MYPYYRYTIYDVSYRRVYLYIIGANIAAENFNFQDENESVYNCNALRIITHTHTQINVSPLQFWKYENVSNNGGNII